MFKFKKRTFYTLVSTAAVGSLFVWYSKKQFVPSGSYSDFPVSRTVRFSNRNDLNITLFQYQTCPFCCKVRAYLDFHAINYKIIEVNSITRNQLKWSDYRKVPIAVIQQKEKPVQINDSSVIISLLESYRLNNKINVEQFNEYYPPIESVEKGKKKLDYLNKYSIMYGQLSENEESMKLEMKWREWIDTKFVHTLSPNIYRTPAEALEAFKYFSETGQWEKYFGFVERQCIIYLGSFVMFILGKVLKKRHNLNDDVRESLYQESNVWIKALNKKNFIGGDSPNLGDLAMYGVLISIEGCSAFKELMEKNKLLGLWFIRVRETMKRHEEKAVAV